MSPATAAYRAGQLARSRGEFEEDNPHPPRTTLWRAWDEGWRWANFQAWREENPEPDMGEWGKSAGRYVLHLCATVKEMRKRDGKPSILLHDVFDTMTGKALLDQWLRCGKWSEGLAVGDVIVFDARGRPDAPWQLGRPIKLVKLTEQQVAELEVQGRA
jgi:hypothetical protein